MFGAIMGYLMKVSRCSDSIMLDSIKLVHQHLSKIVSCHIHTTTRSKTAEVFLIYLDLVEFKVRVDRCSDIPEGTVLNCDERICPAACI